MSETPPASEDKLAVIGAGMCRTATKSLKLALETLYDKPCYHMTEALSKRNNDIAKWLEIFRLVAEGPNKRLLTERIRDTLKGYRCTTDLPACAIYKQLMEIYPEAKVILTLRDSESWIESLRATVMPRELPFTDSYFGLLIQWLVFGGSFQKMCVQAMQVAMGPEVDLSDDCQLLSAYDRRNKEVKQWVPSDRLLVFDPREGWAPLCRFLNFPIPDMPFPYVNEREEIRRILNENKRMRDKLYWLFYSVFGISMASLGYYWFSRYF